MEDGCLLNVSGQAVWKIAGKEAAREDADLRAFITDCPVPEVPVVDHLLPCRIGVNFYHNISVLSWSLERTTCSVRRSTISNKKSR